MLAVAEKASISKKDADSAVNAVIDTIVEALAAEEKVQIVGFGTFEIRSRSARQGRDPRTNSPITIPASKVPAFKAGKAFKDSVSSKNGIRCFCANHHAAACLESATEGCGQDAHTARTGRGLFLDPKKEGSPMRLDNI